MDTTVFSISLVSGAAALAVWAHVRLGRRAPAACLPVLLHLGASLLLAEAVAPDVIRRLGTDDAARALVAVCGVSLPAVGYVFLAALWALKLLQAALLDAASR